MPSITQLQYLISVDKQKHFGRAAAECHVSQPSLSAQVQKAEEELGIIIFDRSKTPVITTDEGKRLVAQAKVVIKEHKKLFELEGSDKDLSGSFKLGVIPTLFPYVVPLFIDSFSKKYPKVNLSILELKTDENVQKLYDDEIDAAILVTPLKDEKIIERSLFFEPFYAFVSEGHDLYKKKKISESELTPDSIWLLDEGHCFRDQVLRLCSLRKQKKIMKNIEFKSGNFDALLNIVRNGHGYTLIPHLAATHLSEDERSRKLKAFKQTVPTREVSIVHARSFLKEKIITAIEAEVLSSIPDELESLKKGNIKVVPI